MKNRADLPAPVRAVTGPTRYLLLAIGWLGVVGATIGAFLPLIPTVPFLLLATFCFSRTSVRLQLWLFNNRLLGPYLRNYLQRKGLTRRQLYSSLASLWLSILLTVFIAPMVMVRIVLVVIALGVTIHLLRMRRLDDEAGS